MNEARKKRITHSWSGPLGYEPSGKALPDKTHFFALVMIVGNETIT